jgi:Ca2+-binding EF-hand superfamily protein
MVFEVYLMKRFAFLTLLTGLVLSSFTVGAEAADKKKKSESTADTGKLFKTLDANSDNKLSLEEYKNLALHLPKPKMTKKNKDKAPSPPDFEGTFKTLDKNGDKYLTLEEFQGVSKLIPLTVTKAKK